MTDLLPRPSVVQSDPAASFKTRKAPGHAVDAYSQEANQPWTSGFEKTSLRARTGHMGPPTNSSAMIARLPSKALRPIWAFLSRGQELVGVSGPLIAYLCVG